MHIDTTLEQLAKDFEFVSSRHQWESGAKEIAWEWAREHPYRAAKIYQMLRDTYFLPSHSSNGTAASPLLCLSIA